MRQRKLVFTTVICLLFLKGVHAQRVVSEARVDYDIQVKAGYPKGEKDLEHAFRGAMLTLWFKANMALADFSTPGYNQSTIYNATTGEATMLREEYGEKYMWILDSAQWRKANLKYQQATFAETDETQEISGYLCKKGLIALADSNLITVYFTNQLQPLAKGYDPMFARVPGLPVQYQLAMGGATITYTLSAIRYFPVSASRFERPKEGYKIIKAPLEGPL